MGNYSETQQGLPHYQDPLPILLLDTIPACNSQASHPSACPPRPSLHFPLYRSLHHKWGLRHSRRRRNRCNQHQRGRIHSPATIHQIKGRPRLKVDSLFTQQEVRIRSAKAHS